MFSLTSTVLTAALALTASAAPASKRAATYTAPYGFGSFELETVGSTSIFDGMFTTGFHTGAGAATTTLTNNQTQGAHNFYNATTGDIIFYSGTPSTIPNSLSFLNAGPYMSNAPAGYNLVVQNAGIANSGLSFNPSNNRLILPQNVAVLSACLVNGVAPYFSIGPEVQLFWRNATTARSTSANCSDVSLKAIFNQGTSLG